MQKLASSESVQEYFYPLRAHVLARIAQAQVRKEPFFHTFIEDVFPDDFYAELHSYMLECKYGDEIQSRYQDNAAYVNRRYSLGQSKAQCAQCFRLLFSDFDVKLALLEKFYIAPSVALTSELSLHDEFEFVFTKAGLRQNIHIDIPPKFVSLVFYLPEKPVAPEEEYKNATILYDSALAPQYSAQFRRNSVCIFVPHFYSYHGFSSTVDRDALVMFYISQDELEHWHSLESQARDKPPFSGLFDAIERKLNCYPLIEFTGDSEKIRKARGQCLVNAPNGRILV